MRFYRDGDRRRPRLSIEFPKFMARLPPPSSTYELHFDNPIFPSFHYNYFGSPYHEVLQCLADDIIEPENQIGKVRNCLTWKCATMPIACDLVPSPGELKCRSCFASLFRTTFSIASPLSSDHIIMTAGCSGAMNIALRTFLNPTDKVLVFAPYYPEYREWIANYSNSREVVLQTTPESKWQPLQKDVSAALTDPDIRVVILNSPNNPTGAVYSAQTVGGIARALRSALQRPGARPIWLLSDSVFVNLADEQPPLFDLYRYTIVCYSISKDCGLAGMRLGCAIVNPQIPQWETVVKMLSRANDALGFFGPHRLGQHVFGFFGRTLEKEKGKVCFNNEGKEFLAEMHARLRAALAIEGKANFARNFEFVPTPQMPRAKVLLKRLRRMGLTLVVRVAGTAFYCDPAVGDFVRISVRNIKKPKAERRQEEEEEGQEEEEEEEEEVAEEGTFSP
jgi:aspartate/methionine/tyrosine aminotransferase